MSNNNDHRERAGAHPIDAQLLLELARMSHTTDSDEAFLVSSLTEDDLAEELVESAVTEV
jgi:hypothetical protein